MTKQSFSMLTSFACVVFVATLAGNAGAGIPTARAGPNLGADPSQPPFFVPWNPTSDSWNVHIDLVVDPSAGPMEKHFQTPTDSAGNPVLLDALQPFPQILWEDFPIHPVPGTRGFAVTDWHEEIHTPGWEWVVPDDAQFPGLFPPGSSLITRNGQPWPWSPIPMPQPDPSKLWVQFPPIPPGNVLDVHKALLWVGTPGNRIWGDNTNDDGTATLDERFIAVWEYPTVPEPTAAMLLCLALANLWLWRVR